LDKTALFIGLYLLS